MVPRQQQNVNISRASPLLPSPAPVPSPAPLLTPHFQGRIDELIQHHENRKETILQVLGNKPKTAYEIASQLPWVPQKGGITWTELDHLNRRMALMETLAHRKILKQEKKVDTNYRDGREFYFAA